MTTLDGDDSELLSAYADRRDAEAFAELVRRYGGLVYSTARRVTGSSADAEDVCQTCFMELARQAREVRSSVGGWLHGTSVRVAAHANRSAARRRKHEQQAIPAGAEGDATQWDQIEPLVDDAIAQLPPELRDPLVMHYLHGVSQSDLAQRLSVNQSTISRRIERAVEQLRASLAQAGVTAPAVAALCTSLTRLMSGDLPQPLAASLTKIGLAGTGGQTVGAGAGLAMAGWAKLVALLVAAVLLTGGVIHLMAGSTPSAMVGPSTRTTMKEDTTMSAADPGRTSPAAAKVRRQDGKVWIEGLEGVNWGGSLFARQDSQVACLVEVLRGAGQDVSYAQLMGLSGCAFKITMGRNLQVPMMHSEFGVEWPPIMRDVFGMEYESLAVDLDEQNNPTWRKQVLAKAGPAIDRGIPALYMDGEWNLLVGYAQDGSTFLGVPYAGIDRGANYPLMSRLRGGCMGDAWFVAVVLPGAGKPKDRRQAVLDSLQTAVRFANAPATKHGDEQMLWGFAAYDIWIDALEERPQDASAHGNAFSYSQLLTSRRAAADYLRSTATGFDAATATHLRSAADRYTAIADRLLAGGSCVAWPWDKNWTPANRAREAELLRQSLANERIAIDEITKVLAAQGITVSPQTQPTSRP